MLTPRNRTKRRKRTWRPRLQVHDDPNAGRAPPPPRRQRPRRPRREALALAVIAFIALIALLVVLVFDEDGRCYTCDVGGEAESTVAPPVTPRPRLFAADSVWNEPLARGAKVDPASPRLMANFAAQIQSEQEQGIGPWIQSNEFSTPLYVVPPEAPTTRVTVEHRPEPSYVDLQRAFNDVPIPANARPAAGTDGHMTIYQPATDTLWEFWQARREDDGWHASWGGAMENVSTNPGYYGPAAYPGATTQWGSTASSLPVIGGTILISELTQGEIDHALAINLPDTREGVFAAPAQRTDGTGGPELLPEGARLRINPDLDLDSLGLPPAGLAIAQAAQRYGMIVRDVTHHATGLFAEDPSPYPSDPYVGLLDDPAQVLARFPWDELQVMKMRLCVTAPCLPAQS